MDLQKVESTCKRNFLIKFEIGRTFLTWLNYYKKLSVTNGQTEGPNPFIEKLRLKKTY